MVTELVTMATKYQKSSKLLVIHSMCKFCKDWLKNDKNRNFLAWFQDVFLVLAESFLVFVKKYFFKKLFLIFICDPVILELGTPSPPQVICFLMYSSSSLSLQEEN